HVFVKPEVVTEGRCVQPKSGPQRQLPVSGRAYSCDGSNMSVTEAVQRAATSSLLAIAILQRTCALTCSAVASASARDRTLPGGSLLIATNAARVRASRS